MADVVVVGGGVAGLAAALRCARGGLSVRVLEAGDRPGGRSATDVVDGFRFDRGAHALARGGHAEAALRELGVAVPRRRAPTAGSAVLLDGALHPFPDDPVALAGAAWLGAGGRLALARWLVEVAIGRLPAGGTAADWLAGLPEGPARRVASAVTRTSAYTGDLDRMDAAVAAAQVRLGLRHGVDYVEGGWQTLVDALADRARAAGVEVRLRCAARRARPGAVETAEGVETAGAVILAVPPERAAALLGAPIDHAAPARAGALQLALREDVLEGPVRRLVFDCDRPVFVSVFSTVVPLGPAGAHVVHALRYGTSDHALADVEATLDRVWPRWRAGVLARRWMPTLPVSPALPEPGRPRPGIDAAGLPGVWLAGDAYGPDGHLVDAAFASAAAAADAVLAGAARVGSAA